MALVPNKRPARSGGRSDPTSFTIENKDITYQKNELRKLNKTVDDYKTLIDRHKNIIKEGNQKLTAYNRKSVDSLLANKRVPPLVMEELNEHITNIKRYATSNIISNKSALSVKTKSLTTTNKKIFNTEKSLASLIKKYPSKIVNINDIKMALVDVSHVDWQRSAFHYNIETNGYSLKLYFTGVTVKGSLNPFDNITVDTYTMSDTSVTFNFYNEKIYIRNVSDDKQPTGYSSGSTHPHILQRGEPCLGDFFGHITEAKSRYDWAELATVTLLFLEQAYTDDAAGKHWPKWVLADCGGRKRMNWINYCSTINYDSLGNCVFAYATTDHRERPILHLPLVSKERKLKWVECFNNRTDITSVLKEEGLIK